MLSVFLLIINLFASINPALALSIDQSPSVQPTATDSPTINNDEIQKIRQAVQQKVKEKLQEITAVGPTKKAFVGTIDQIDNNQIQISYQNQTFNLSVDDQTVYIDTNRSKTSLDNISSGQAILALGIYDPSINILETKRLILVEKDSLEDQTQTVSGQIVDVSQSSPIFVLVPNSNKDLQYQIKTDKNTEFTKPDQTDIKFADLESGQKAIVVLEPQQNGSKTYLATKVIQLASTTNPTPTPQND